MRIFADDSNDDGDEPCNVCGECVVWEQSEDDEGGWSWRSWCQACADTEKAADPERVSR